MGNISLIFGVLGIITVIFGLYQKKDSSFFLYLSLHSLFMGFHYLFLGLFSGAGVNFIDFLKNIFGYFHQKNKFIIYSLVIAYIAIGVFTFDYTILGTLPILASLISIYSVFFTSGENLRSSYIVIFSIWFLYNLFSGSIPGIILTLFLLGELSYSYYKIHTEKKKVKKKILSVLGDKKGI